MSTGLPSPLSARSRQGKRLVWLILALTGVAVLLRALRLSWQPLWWDEGYSVYFATEPLARMLDLTAHDIHPPLYYALLHGWIALWGSAAPPILRLLSVALGALAIPLLAWMAWRLFPGRPRIWLLAVGLLVLNPMHLFYSQEVRMYGLGMALSIASTAFFWEWMQPPSRERTGCWPPVGYALVTAAGLYTLYYFVFVPLGHLAWTLIAHRRRRHRIWPVVGVQALIAALFAPWLFYTLPKLTAYVGHKVASDRDSPLDPLQYAARHLAAFSGGHIAWPVGGVPWPLLFAGATLFLLLIALLLWRRNQAPSRNSGSAFTPDHAPERSAAGLLSLLVVTALVGGWLVNLRFPFFPEGGERLLLFALPYALLLLAAGVDRFWSVASLGKMALLLWVIAGAGGVVAFYVTPRYANEDYRPIVRQIIQQGRNQDAMLAIFPWQVGYWRAYAPQRDPRVTGPAPLLLSDRVVGWSAEVQARIDAALQKGVLWFPEPLAFGATLPHEIEAYLAKQAFNLENRWYGATRLTAWAKLPAPLSRGEKVIDFGAVKLVEAGVEGDGVEAANQPIAVTLDWQVVEPADLNISLRILDDAGHVWSSREYAADWSSVQPGFQQRHTVGVIVPVGLPPGAYTIGVSVARQDARGESAAALTIRGSDAVNAAIGGVTVLPPEETQSPARLPMRTPLEQPVVQDGVAFLGFTAPDPATPLLAGTELAITLFLQAQEDAPSDRLLYVSLLDRRGNGVAGYEGWPLPGAAPPALVDGELLQVPVRFFTPGALSSGDYRLAAGFQLKEQEAKTPPVALGAIRLQQRRAVFTEPSPAVRLPSPAQLGSHALLYGYTLEPLDDGRILLRLYWQVIQPLLPPHHIFVHVEAPDGAILAQQDGPPVNEDGLAPTGSWQPGEFLVTQHTLQAPKNAVLKVGLYNPSTLVRLPVTIDGETIGDSVTLP
ncbi:hypothetical protein [Caldilinea sp.]|uniref:hypothetical protein n=1 Tax=Caldilinea sp. TaxID=2293560 RepID=UPI0021DD8C00|nr:hypothetical protein [Caldilinea sp.]GIV68378.1 MAG: hypothetical protein KatS3mg048_1240 [Caldilinea sp.]